MTVNKAEFDEVFAFYRDYHRFLNDRMELLKSVFLKNPHVALKLDGENKTTYQQFKYKMSKELDQN